MSDEFRYFQVFVDEKDWNERSDKDAKQRIKDSLHNVVIYDHILSIPGRVAVSIADVINAGIIESVTLHKHVTTWDNNTMPIANTDEECICKGNWRQIVKETEHLIGSKYLDRNGKIFTFYGVVHGSDDYYYGMWRLGDCQLLSCVGSIEGHGYVLREDPTDEDVPELIAEMFSILDTKEESDNGVLFNPTSFTSCRVMDAQRLSEILKKLRKFSGVKDV